MNGYKSKFRHVYMVLCKMAVYLRMRRSGHCDRVSTGAPALLRI